MTKRRRATVFGEVAGTYDDVRPGYPDALVDAVLDYAGAPPKRVVEVGAGTGKATVAFAARSLRIVCVEPDRQMASLLRDRFATVDTVAVEVCRFEDWAVPDGGVDLLYCAQAWHWVDAQTRSALAHAALTPGGVFAVFGHGYLFADATLEAALREAYRVHAPELLDDPAQRPKRPDDVWFTVELRASGLFADVRAYEFRSVLPYPKGRYLALLDTFSAHRMLPPPRREALFTAVAEVVEAHGGIVDVDLATTLALARRP